MVKLLLIGCGGFLGSVLRYLLTALTHIVIKDAILPYGTLVVNVLGCLAIGFLAALVETKHLLSASVQTFLVVGFLGGFTTFSTFGNESFGFLREGQNGLMLLNVLLNVVVGFTAVWLGNELGKGIW